MRRSEPRIVDLLIEYSYQRLMEKKAAAEKQEKLAAETESKNKGLLKWLLPMLLGAGGTVAAGYALAHRPEILAQLDKIEDNIRTKISPSPSASEEATRGFVDRLQDMLRDIFKTRPTGEGVKEPTTTSYIDEGTHGYYEEPTPPPRPKPVAHKPAPAGVANTTVDVDRGLSELSAGNVDERVRVYRHPRAIREGIDYVKVPIHTEIPKLPEEKAYEFAEYLRRNPRAAAAVRIGPQLNFLLGRK